MLNFITGLLEENEDGATYEGKVYDRFLKLRHSSGVTISIFDGYPISTGLAVGGEYSLVLLANIFDVLESLS